MQAVNEGVTYKSIHHSPKYKQSAGAGAVPSSTAGTGKDGSQGGQQQQQSHQRSGSDSQAPNNRAADPRLARQLSPRVSDDVLGRLTASTSGSHARKESFTSRELHANTSNAFNTRQLQSSLPASGVAAVFGGDEHDGQQAQRMPQGILKAPQTSANASAENIRRIGNELGKQAAGDKLAGQKVKVNGLEKPIKSFKKTMEALRFGAYNEAFEVKEATTYEADDTATTTKSKPTHLAVYFPMRRSRTESHDPKECGHLCRGQPHVDIGPVCRFCREKIGRRNGDERIYYPDTALEHLAGRDCKVSYEDKVLLLDAFQTVDREALGFSNGTQQDPYKRIVASHSRQASETRKPRTPSVPSVTRPVSRKPAQNVSRPILAKQSISTAPRIPTSEAQRLLNLKKERERAQARLEYEMEQDRQQEGTKSVQAGQDRYDSYIAEDEEFDDLAHQSMESISNANQATSHASSKPAVIPSAVASTSRLPGNSQIEPKITSKEILPATDMDDSYEVDPDFLGNDTFDSQADNHTPSIPPANERAPTSRSGITALASLDLLQSVRESAPAPRLAHLDRNKGAANAIVDLRNDSMSAEPAPTRPKNVLDAKTQASAVPGELVEMKERGKKKKRSRGWKKGSKEKKRDKGEKKEKNKTDGRILPMPIPGLNDPPVPTERVLASVDFGSAVPGLPHAGRSASSASGTLFRPASPAPGVTKAEPPASSNRAEATGAEDDQDVHDLMQGMMAKEEKGKARESRKMRSLSVEQVEAPAEAKVDVVMISDDSEGEQAPVRRPRSVSSDFGDVPMSELFSETNSVAGEEENKVDSRASSQTTRRRVVVESNETSDSDDDIPIRASSQVRGSRKQSETQRREAEHVSESSSQAEITLAAASSSSDDEIEEEEREQPTISTARSKKQKAKKTTVSPDTKGKMSGRTAQNRKKSPSVATSSESSASEEEDVEHRKKSRRAPPTKSSHSSSPEAASESDSDSSDAAVYVQASWDPKKLAASRKPVTTQNTTKRRASPSEHGTSTDSDDQSDDEQERSRRSEPTRPSATTNGKKGSAKGSRDKASSSRKGKAPEVPLQKSKKPGAGARKTGRPMRQPKKAGPTSPNKSSAKKRRQASVESEYESSGSSSSGDSDDGMVADSPEMTDVDTEEEEEHNKRAKLKRTRLRMSTVGARSSPAKPTLVRKRKRINESSEEESAIEEGGDEQAEESDDEMAIPLSATQERAGKHIKQKQAEMKEKKRQLVRARDALHKEKSVKKQKTSVRASSASSSSASSREASPQDPVQASGTSGQARLSPINASAGPVKVVSDDFPPDLRKYRNALKDNEIDSIATLAEAVVDPNDCIKFVEYLADGSDDAVFRSKPKRFAFAQAIQRALTGRER